MELDLHASGDGGRTWKKTATVKAGTASSPPAALLRKGRLDVVFSDAEKKPKGMSVDLATGKASEPAPLGVEGVTLDNRPWPELVELKGALVLFCRDGKTLSIVRSGDEGKTWAKLETPELKMVRSDGICPAVFACGEALHVVLSPDLGSIEHWVATDGGKTWKKRETAFQGKGSKLFSYAGAASGKHGVILFGSYEESKRKAWLHAATSSDGGETWSTGGEVMESRFNDPQMFRSVAASGGRFAFFGCRTPHEGGGRTGEGLLLLTEDGGTSWKDAGAAAGLERNNFLGHAAFTKDGLVAVFLNSEGFSFERAEGNFVLARRRGKASPAALTEAELAAFAKAVEQLRDEDVGVREKAAEAIAALGARARLALETAIAQAKDAEVRAALEQIRKKMTPAWRK
jgi:hypothetical protein